jgi:hypothetical protein
VSIESALTALLKRLTPVVKQAPYNGQRPTGSYITFQPMAIIPQRSPMKKRMLQPDGETFTETDWFHSEMTVSINAYGPKGYSLLMGLHGLKQYYEARGALSAEGMALITIGQARNLSELGDEAYRTRWQSDVIFHISPMTQFDDYRLRQFYVTGQWVSTDDVINIETIAPSSPAP